MQRTIEWLTNIEGLAAAFYKDVSETFREDGRISEFFSHLATEEGLHLQLMKNALNYLPGLKEKVSPFLVDSSTREKIEDAFSASGELLASGDLDRGRLLDCLVTAEFSEWNDIFVFVIRSLKEVDREFPRAAAKIQQHLREIEGFLEELPEGRKYRHVIRCLPPVWNEKILIVEDQEAVREFLGAVLKHEGAIETARDGQEALAKVKDGYFDVIFSDVGLPLMDGVEFYKKAVETDPGIGDRFLFITGRPDEKYLSFFERNNLRYLLKPASIREIKRHVDEILSRAETKS